MSHLMDKWHALDRRLPEAPDAPLSVDAMTEIARLMQQVKTVLRDPRPVETVWRDARWIERRLKAVLAGKSLCDIDDPGDDHLSTTRKIHTPDGDANSASHLSVTRFSMGERGLGLQLTINDARYVQLTPEQRLELYDVLGDLFGTTPPESRGPAQVITRDEVIAYLRERGYVFPRASERGHSGMTSDWLVERLAITKQDLATEVTVTLSRDALTKLGAYLSTAEDLSPIAPVLDEIRDAVANAKPDMLSWTVEPPGPSR